MEKNYLKRIKTVDNLLIQKFETKDYLSDISNLRDKESVFITINNIQTVKKNENFSNNYNRKKRTIKKRRSNNSVFRYRNKLYKFDENEKENNDEFSKIMKNLIGPNVQNLNININFQQIGQSNTKDSVTNYKKKSVNKNLWKKTKNFQKMFNAIRHPETTKIIDEESLRDTLMENNLKKSKFRRSVPTKMNKEITLAQFMRKSPVEKEFIRVNLKEQVFKLIVKGELNDKSKEITEELEKLFNQNPEKNKYTPYDEKYLFNQKLSNGKTLMYIACQEGNKDIVKYFLEKNLNPNIRICYNDYIDSCLGVAVRWGFIDIVKILLESKKIYPNIIREVLEFEDCNKTIKEMLIKSLPEYKRKKSGCECF